MTLPFRNLMDFVYIHSTGFFLTPLCIYSPPFSVSSFAFSITTICSKAAEFFHPLENFLLAVAD